MMDGVRRGFGCGRGDWEKRRVCLTVGEVRNGRVRDFYCTSVVEGVMACNDLLPCNPGSTLADHLRLVPWIVFLN